MGKIRRYAEGTKVSIEQSKAQLESLLRKHGATGFVHGWDAERGVAVIQFRMHERMLKYRVVEPRPLDYKTTDAGVRRSPDQVRVALAREHRRRWRALLLILKAKFEMVASGDVDFEHEFLANIMLPDGSTIGEKLTPQIAASYGNGAMPPLLGTGE